MNILVKDRGAAVDFRLGIVGTGLIVAGSHLPAALGCPGVKVTLLVDQVVERAQKLAQAYSFNPKVCRSISEGLDSVDGFIIATPNSTHCELALQCIDAGKHVLIEKPLANTATEGESIKRAAEARNVVVAVGFCTRFRNNVQMLHRLLNDNYFGRVTRFVHQFGTPGGWAPLSGYTLNRQSSGGGSLIVTGSHFLDRMIHFWGMPETCSLADDGLDGPEANCVARFSYSGLTGMARYSKTGRLPGGLVIEAERGVVVLKDTDDAFIEFHPRAWPSLCETIRLQPEPPQADVFQLQILDFVHACRTSGQVMVDIQQGLQSLRLTEMLYTNRSRLQERWYAEASE